MEIDKTYIPILAHHDLQRAVTGKETISADGKRVYQQLLDSPVEVALIKDVSGIDSNVVDISSRLAGSYSKFSEVKEKLNEIYYLGNTQNPSFSEQFPLSVFFDGIYAGNPIDLYKSIKGEARSAKNAVKGAGKRVARISFL